MTTWIEPPEATEVYLYGDFKGSHEGGCFADLLAHMENPSTQDPESTDFVGQRIPLQVIDPAATPENAADKCAELLHRHCFARVRSKP